MDISFAAHESGQALIQPTDRVGLVAAWLAKGVGAGEVGWANQAHALLEIGYLADPGDPMRYTLGCSLSYNILSDTTFIFNLEVARLKSVEILSESLVLTPNLKRDIYITPDLQNRYLGLNVPTGQFALEYNAEVDLSVHRADPA